MSKNAEEALKTIEGLQEIIVKARIADNENRENFYKLKAENSQLKELNREMVEVLSWAAEHSTSLHLDLLIKIRELLTKAEGKEEWI